jgi:hypothetical protein
MIETELFTFSSAPKTGCRWMRGFVERYFPHNHYGNLHTPSSIKGKPSIAHVRNPADWFRSFYQNFASTVGNPAVDVFLSILPERPNNPKGQALRKNLDGLCRSIELYLKEFEPNTIHDAFYSYPADFRWRLEDMPGPIFWLTDTPFDETIDRVPTQHTLSIPEELRQAIYEHEPELMNKWRYK